MQACQNHLKLDTCALHLAWHTHTRTHGYKLSFEISETLKLHARAKKSKLRTDPKKKKKQRRDPLKSTRESARVSVSPLKWKAIISDGFVARAVQLCTKTRNNKVAPPCRMESINKITRNQSSDIRVGESISNTHAGTHTHTQLFYNCNTPGKKDLNQTRGLRVACSSTVSPCCLHVHVFIHLHLRVTRMCRKKQASGPLIRGTT